MSKENREKANMILFEDACSLMKDGDYTTAAVFLRLSVLLGNHDCALQNLYDQALDEDRWLIRIIKTTFYRMLLSLFNSKRLLWIKDSHKQWQLIWLNSVTVRCPHCGEVNRMVNLEETGGWMECTNCCHSIQVVKDGVVQNLPLLRTRESI